MKREPLRIRLTLDDGLASYLRALVKSPVGIFGDERATIIFAVRMFLIEKMNPKSGFFHPILRELPPDLQKVWASQGFPLQPQSSFERELIK